MKTKEELAAIKAEYEALNKKLAGLNEDELAQVSGGAGGIGGGGGSSPVPAHGAVADYAKSRIGCPFVFGAAGPDAFDASGLVVWCYGKIGISLPHHVDAMYAMAKERVSVSQARPGDVLYRPGHVAVSLGGSEGIYAPNAGATVCRGSGNYTCALRF